MSWNERRASLSSTRLSPLGLPDLHRKEKRQTECPHFLSQPHAGLWHKDAGGRDLATGPLESSACGHAVNQEPRVGAMEAGPENPHPDLFLTKGGCSTQTHARGQT